MSSVNKPIAAPTARRSTRPAQAPAARSRGVISNIELRKPTIAIGYVILVVVLALLTITTVYPLYWMYSGGLKSSQELIQTPPSLLPQAPAWENYPEAWSNLNYSRYFTNTLVLAAGALLLQFLVSATAAYALSKLKPVGSSIVLFLFLSTLMVPPEAYLIPQYLAVVRVPIFGIRLIDTWWAVWLPRAINAFHIFILKSFFDQVPQDLMDAARIDGAKPWQVFIRILVPLSTAVLAVVAIFTVIAQWKDFFWPFLVLKSAHLQPIMVALYRLTNQSNPEPMNIIVAGLAIASTPMIILFLIFQRQILQGITLTGLKG